MAFRTFFKLSQEIDTPESTVEQPIQQPIQQQTTVGTIETFVNKGRKGSYLAVSVNAVPEIKKQANAKFIIGFSGYNEFKGKPTKLVTIDNIAEVEAEINEVAKIFNLEVNSKGLEYAKSTLAGEKYTPKQSKFKAEDLIVPGDVDATVDNLATKFKDILKGIPA